MLMWENKQSHEESLFCKARKRRYLNENVSLAIWSKKKNRNRRNSIYWWSWNSARRVLDHDVRSWPLFGVSSARILAVDDCPQPQDSQVLESILHWEHVLGLGKRGETEDNGVDSGSNFSSWSGSVIGVADKRALECWLSVLLSYVIDHDLDADMFQVSSPVFEWFSMSPLFENQQNRPMVTLEVLTYPSRAPGCPASQSCASTCSMVSRRSGRSAIVPSTKFMQKPLEVPSGRIGNWTLWSRE